MSQSSPVSPIVLVLLFVLGGALTAFGTYVLHAESAEVPRPGGSDARTAALDAAIDRIDRRLDSIEERLDAPRAAVDADTARAPVGLAEADVRALVADMIASEGADADARLVDAASEDSPDAVVESLLAAGVFSPEAEAIWDRLKQEGRLDAVLDAFRARAEADPDNADKQAAYGDALIAKLRRAENQKKVEDYARKADMAYDEALDIDPQHWNARFSKAISYSFWPAITGKPAEAMRHFETLIEQQSTMPKQPVHAQSYLMLGNLHAQRGEMDKAREVWTEGVYEFPNNDELREKVGQ